MIVPGQIARVGRSAPSDLLVPHDDKLADVHFELEWDGARCLLRDASGEGTWLGGERVREGVVPPGGWLRAGETDFSAYVERVHQPFPAGSPQQDSKAQVLGLLRAQSASLYAVLDTTRSPRILALLRESVEDYRSLYEGVKGDALEEQAPYVVHLPRESALLEPLVHEGWGHRWGIYLVSPLALDEVRRHLRRFLRVEMEGRSGFHYFRFYDPRYVGHFLNACSPLELARFLGPNLIIFYEKGLSLERMEARGLPQCSTPGAFMLRHEHMHSLKRAVVHDFEERMMAWLRNHLGSYCGEMDDAQLLWAIQDGLMRAHSYNMVTERAACIYICAQFVCGRDFDVEVSWGTQILNDSRFTSPTERARALVRALELHRGIQLPV
ncbi:DUF4123 domain-containing protein [Cystobacter fuscus]|uniref:DUF4123 domain-containing protein n=1 Tax=Cystobacter fuscus TaxID=43 RepID=UPI0037C06AC7